MQFVCLSACQFVSHSCWTHKRQLASKAELTTRKAKIQEHSTSCKQVPEHMYLAYIHSWRGVLKPSQWGVMCHIGLCKTGLGWVNVFLPFSLRSLGVYCLMQTSTQWRNGFDMEARGKIAVLSIARKLFRLKKQLPSTTLMSPHTPVNSRLRSSTTSFVFIIIFSSSVAYRFNVWHLLSHILFSVYVVHNITINSLFRPFNLTVAFN